MLRRLIESAGEMFVRVDSFDRETWLYIFAGLVVVGFLCMRGFTMRM